MFSLTSKASQKIASKQNIYKKINNPWHGNLSLSFPCFNFIPHKLINLKVSCVASSGY